MARVYGEIIEGNKLSDEVRPKVNFPSTVGSWWGVGGEFSRFDGQFSDTICDPISDQQG